MRRSDGYLLKDLKPFMKIIPYIMEKRSDSQNFSKQVFPAESIDKYIAEKKQSGYSFSYMHVFVAAYVRLVAERPQLNRFVMNNRYIREIKFMFQWQLNAHLGMRAKRQPLNLNSREKKIFLK